MYRFCLVLLFDLANTDVCPLYQTAIHWKFDVLAIFRESETGFVVFYDPMYRNSCRNSIYRPFFRELTSDQAKYICTSISRTGPLPRICPAYRNLTLTKQERKKPRRGKTGALANSVCFLCLRSSNLKGWGKCFLFSRNIGWLTPKIIYLRYLKKSFLDQSIQKTFYLILKKEALDGAQQGILNCPTSCGGLVIFFQQGALISIRHYPTYLCIS